ncbi:hypothetical protein GW17_00037015 [Ensete ventricosum]|nr:hypothetical protein GW17_00037015 [Ensete ventricosum]
MHRNLPPRHHGSCCHLYAPPLLPLSFATDIAPAQVTALHVVGRCPWAAPRGRTPAVPAGDTFMGATPLRASRGRYCCSLAVGKHRPLRASCELALPLQPGVGRASPLVGWPQVAAPAGDLA